MKQEDRRMKQWILGWPSWTFKEVGWTLLIISMPVAFTGLAQIIGLRLLLGVIEFAVLVVVAAVLYVVVVGGCGAMFGALFADVVSRSAKVRSVAAVVGAASAMAFYAVVTALHKGWL